MENKVVKENFYEWYKYYCERQRQNAEQEYWEMLETYNPPPERLSFDDAYGLLAGTGFFFDFNCDECESELFTKEFMELCNR